MDETGHTQRAPPGISALTTPQTSVRRSRRDSTVGILRLDIGRPRRNSGGSIEYLAPFADSAQEEPASPQPSVDRLSVTFALDVSAGLDERSDFSGSSPRGHPRPPLPASPPPVSAPAPAPRALPGGGMEKVHFSRETTVTDGEEDEEEDYSASVSAIMQRRASTRRPSKRRSRRPSSPFSPDADSGQSAARRRSSVFTTSSGDTAISMDEGTTQEQIYENLRLHKEVLSSVKQQPWTMRRKLRLVQQAKAYVKRHEGELQERLAQSKTTRDILARVSILRGKFWQYLKRELNNLINALVPWELRIKEIESHFGSVVASYFIFLRWLFWVNLVLATLLGLFVVMPEMLMADRKSAGGRKEMLPEEVPKSRSLVTLWNFEGILKYSPIFYGYFTNRDGNMKGYRLPFAYFMTGLAVYIYSFVATLRRMAENSRMSKLSEKDDECVFTWKLLSGWDYMIGNAETAHNRVASIILGFKEALLEEAEKKKDARNWKVIALRVMVNMFVLVLLISSAYAVVEVVKRSKNTDGEGWWRQNEITVVLSLISFVFPLLFEALGLLESYHPRKQLRIQLARIMVLNLLNLYTLIFALFDKIEGMTIELKALKPNDTQPTASYRHALSGGNFDPGLEPPTLSLQNISDSATACFQILVPCTTPSSAVSSAVNVTASLIAAFMMSKFFTTPTPFQQSANASDSLSNGSFTTSVFDYLNVTGGNFSLSYLNMTEEDLVTALNLSNETSGSFDYYSSHSEEDQGEARFDYEDASDATEMASASSIEYTVEILSRYVTEMLANMSTTTESSWAWNQSTTTDLYDSNSTLDYSIETFNFSTTLDEILPTLTSILRNLSTQVSVDINETQSEDIRSVVDGILTTLSSRETPSDAELCYETRCNDSTSEMASSAGEASSDSPWATATSTSFDDLLLMRTDTDNSSVHLSLEKKKRLRYLCWETMFGQELVKLTVMDLVITIFSTLLVDFFRAIFVRVMNNCWCWDLEKQFPQYGDFKIAENILHLVNNQGMVWMGMFFSPALPLLNLIKLGILMYLRSWAVLTCNVPHEIVFRASRSNNFYFALLLTMLFLCVLPVGYAIVWVEPSWHCGPFSNYSRIYHMFTKSLYKFMPEKLHLPMDYIASPGIVIPLLMLLVLIIYYLISLTGALREANNDLKIQLRRERTEERRKMFQLVDRRRRKGSGADSNDTPFARWKKILPVLPTHKAASGDVGIGDGDDKGADSAGNVKADSNRNELISRLMKRALRKSSATSDEESVLIADGNDGNSKPTKARPKKADFKHIVDATKKKDKESKGKTCPRKNGETSKKKTEPSTTEDQNEMADREGSSKERPPKNHGKHHPSNKKRASIRSKSPSTSSTKSNKERGEDSQNSGVWSDNIPVIRIIKTDSTDILDAHQQAEPQQPSKSSSSDTVVAVPVASSSGVVPKSYEQKQVTERKALARALLKEARRWREQEDRKGREQVAMIEIPTDDGPAVAACEDHPEVYI